MRDDDGAAPLAEQFARFGVTAGRNGAPLYAQICRGVAEDPDLLALATTAPAAQRRPNLLLAAVHYLLLGGVEHPLAAHYPTLADGRRRSPGAPSGAPRRAPPPIAPGGADPAPGAAFGQFRAFCRDHRRELIPVLATRATQTNEIGRCAALLPALATVAAGTDRPLGLIDLGASAGLNLLFDRYAYRYRPGGPAGRPGSPVTIDCEVRGAPLGVPRAPTVAHRRAVDERPVDLADPDDARWLLACQWPDETERFHRLHDAMTMARSDPGRVPVDRGELVDDLGPVAATIPDHAHLCLFHTWVAAYLTTDRQRALADAVREVAQTRPVSWLFAESPYEAPALPVPDPPAGGGVPGATALVLVDFPGGRERRRRLADMHPHGRWLCWWEGPDDR